MYTGQITTMYDNSHQRLDYSEARHQFVLNCSQCRAVEWHNQIAGVSLAEVIDPINKQVND